VNQSWNFTGIEFQVLCEKYRSGDLPDPLFYTLDEPMTFDQSARLKEKTWEELRARWDPTWDAMIDVMCAPEFYIRIHGWDELDIDNGQKSLWMHFARRGAQAFKFDQKPGKSYWHTDGFVVTECDPRSLANEVVRSLPAVDAGRLPSLSIIIDPAEHVGNFGGSFFRDDDDDPPAIASAKFFNMRASLTGSIIIVQGRSKYGPRGIHETKMLFRDVIGDGRYVMAMDGSPIAEATGPKQFAARIQKDIDNLMERLDTHWEEGYPEDRY
jgi:hypothetical protein